uniref:Uncharacterized protein n=1 Tax=Schistocephalus solidus TaxID=70667 RepID=A0A0V0J7F1_SCHSO
MTMPTTKGALHATNARIPSLENNSVSWMDNTCVQSTFRCLYDEQSGTLLQITLLSRPDIDFSFYYLIFKVCSNLKIQTRYPLVLVIGGILLPWVPNPLKLIVVDNCSHVFCILISKYYSDFENLPLLVNILR